MKTVQTDIFIEASPSKVWQTLVDFDAFQEWNPFIVRIKGGVKVGEQLTLSIKIPGSSPIQFSPVLQKVSSNDALIWKGKFFITGLFDGEHHFILEATEKGTHFIHEEFFSGLLTYFLPKSFFQKTRQGFEAMNLALKERVEGML